MQGHKSSGLTVNTITESSGGQDACGRWWTLADEAAALPSGSQLAILKSTSAPDAKRQVKLRNIALSRVTVVS